MATNRSAVPPAEAWKLGRAATIPVTAAWVGAAGAVLNTAGIGGTGTFVLGGITVVATACTAAGAYAKSLNEKAQGLTGMNTWQVSYLTTCACAAGSWITWATATLPWAPYTAGSFVAGTLAAWLLYPWYRSSRREAIAAEHAAQHPTTEERPLTDWETICEQGRLKGMEQVGDTIETPGGYLVRLKLPLNGSVTFDAFLGKLPSLSVIAGHRLGLRSGALRAEPGRNDAEVLLHVTERDVLAELIPLPHDLALIDSNDPFDIGLHEDATPLYFDVLRHGMVVGVTDSGKSNTLNVIIKKLGQCVDTLLWVIDPKGGRMIRPWIQPLLDGKVQRSVLDWVATNGGPTTMGSEKFGTFTLNKSPDEYHHLLDTAIAEMERRSNLAIGGEKVTTSPDLPRIIIIIDEAADVLGDHQLKEKCKLIVRKGRSEGIMLLIAGQRGTASMLGDGDFRSQIQNTIGLGVRSRQDANMVFPDDSGISKLLPKLVHQGTLAVKRGSKGRAIPGKGYRIEMHEIEPLSIALSGRRPGLPADAAAFHGSVYADRWAKHRIQHLFVTSTDQLRKSDTPTGGQAPRPAAGPNPTTTNQPGPPSAKNRNILDAFARRGRDRQTANDKPDADLSPEGEAIAADFQRFLAGIDTTKTSPAQAPTPAASAPEPGADPRRTLVRRIVRDAGPHGAQTEDLWSALTAKFGTDWNRSVVTTWITEDCRTGIMHRPVKGRIVHGPKPLDEQARGE